MPDGTLQPQRPPFPEDAAAVWADAIDALNLLAVDPAGLGGIVLRAAAGPVRDIWMALLPPLFANRQRMPAAIGDEALLGGLDLAATLQASRPVHTRGLLAAAEGGLILAAMAERMPAGLAARLAGAIDGGAGFGIVALDEGIEPEERPPAALLDRLAFSLDFSVLSHRDTKGFTPDPAATLAARALLPQVIASDEALDAICGTALALGVDSARGPLLALRAARAAAALDGRTDITPEDAELAARLVLAPRATRMPAAEPPPAEDQPPQEPPPPEPPPEDNATPPDQPPDAPDNKDDEPPDEPEDDPDTPDPETMADLLLAAAVAAIPPDLLARLRAQQQRAQGASQGREGARQRGSARGRPVGVRAAPPAPGLRLNLIETLRAAAPWQPLRKRAPNAPVNTPPGRVLLRRDDFRVTRTEQRARSTTVFVVDASGSSALNRLGEAKGAVELLLADCYTRRDQVAVIAFRGKAAQILLPPTRSLVRAKRSLAALPGGGGTPLAAGIDAGFLLAETVRRSGATPLLVLLTDGRANVTQAGTGGRGIAANEASQAARRVRAAGLRALVLDTAPRPGPEARGLAEAMGALYVPLPYANAASVSAAVRAASA